ncbi:MAG: TrkH family potassium uptake protein [Cytophagales bacterium]|nr:TrkH family potassium uptake protein [Cytophagales bacterium]
MHFNWKVILRVIGILLIMNACFMLLCIPFTLIEHEGDIVAITLSAGITGITGAILFWLTKEDARKELMKRDGYLIVTLGWLILTLFGTLPYLLSGAIPDPSNAFFESMSGFTATGATILEDIESVHKGILFWRSLTQWIGGLGMIVLAVAILPLLGIGGMQLFVAEAPGISPDKLQPRIKETAKRLWYIYIGLTGLQVLITWAFGMSFYDAINHALTTMSSAGFSTKNASLGAFSPTIQYIVIVFMLLAGTNFTMIYLGLHGQFNKVLKNEEFRYYLGIVFFVSLIIGFSIHSLGHGTLEKSMRDAFFQVISILTTTGYSTWDYTAWGSFITIAFLLLMFHGASTGSTSGGVKLVRHVLLIRNGWLELKRQIHPSAILPVRYNGKAVSQDIIYNVLAFIMIYISIFAVGSVFVAASGVDFVTALGATAACLGNVGPGIGEVGPSSTFVNLPDISKWFLSFLMLIGRLELFTFLVLFTPSFWRKN